MKQDSQLKKNYSILRDKIFERRPILKQIVKNYGNMSLLDYSKTFYRSGDYFVDQSRQNEFISVIKEEVERIYGTPISDSVAAQLNISFHAANTEHHGPIGSPRQLNNNLITSLPFIATKDKKFPVSLLIACANISFNNWTFPRGFLFHTFTKKGLNENQLVFFGHTVEAYPLYNSKPFNEQTLQQMKKNLYTLWNEKYVGGNEYKKLLGLIDTIFADPRVLNATTYTDQSALINLLLWKQVFLKFGYDVPDLIFIEQERLANLLISKHLSNKESVVYRILFEEKQQALFTKWFEGITCGFSEKTQYGTYLFWGLPKGKKYRTQLWKHGNELVAPDNSYKVELTPSAIKKAILGNEIIPSTLLSFIVFCFYYGLRQIGGPNQTTYLTQMKEAFIAMQKEYGDDESIEKCKDVPTTDFLPGSPPILAFLESQDNQIVPATILDLFLYGAPQSIEKFIEKSKHITLEESVSRTYPAWYKRCYLEDEREPELESIKDADIDQITGINKKITPFARIEMNRIVRL